MKQRHRELKLKGTLEVVAPSISLFRWKKKHDAVVKSTDSAGRLPGFKLEFYYLLSYLTLPYLAPVSPGVVQG